jgi:hypothetical protein
MLQIYQGVLTREVVTEFVGPDEQPLGIGDKAVEVTIRVLQELDIFEKEWPRQEGTSANE